jgi:tetratricopeptide (TPR) repeat protein
MSVQVEPRVRRPAAPTSSDPIDIAMEAAASGAAADSPAQRLLVKQERLVGWQIGAARAAIAGRLLVALGGMAVAVAVAALLWDARSADGIVVDAFAVPPDLATRGLSGEAVAAQVVDGLTTLAAETRSSFLERGVRDGTAAEVSVEIPGAGVSLGELQKTLRRWLGSETHIRGEVFRTPTGLAIRARAAGAAPIRVEGPEADFETLTLQVAKAAYGQADPVRYAAWVSDREGAEASLAFLRQAANAAQPPARMAAIHERMGYYMGLLGDPHAAAREARYALSLDPYSNRALSQLGGYEAGLGHQEASLKWRRQALKTVGRAQGFQVAPDLDRASIAALTADFATAEAANLRASADPAQIRNNSGQNMTNRAGILARLHRTSEAQAVLAAVTPQQDDKVQRDVRSVTLARFNQFFLAEDWSAALAMEPAVGAFQPADPSARAAAIVTNNLAIAHARTGDIAGAQALIAAAAADCDRCVLTSAQIAAMAGRVPESDQLFARAAAMMPSFPQPHYEWGRARLARGDLAGALAEFRIAQKRQPHWADPFKLEGDALMAQGKAAEAQAAYARSAPLAPRWGGLQLAWGKALAKLGKLDQAKAKWAAAATMDLTPAERAELESALKAVR